ncbi:MAG TPA: hypothetical protein VF411_05230, partial [Bacteroidia bacterium]
MKLKIFIVFSCLLFLTCRKDPPLPIHECVDVADIPTFNDTIYNTPCFNPNNSNEIIYVQGIQSIHKSNLVKQNLSTGHKTYIISDIWQKPDWSVKDWIVFNHADNQVWKIKTNGDSLQQLTSQGGLEAIWDKTGNKIAYWTETGIGQTNTYYTFITDISGNIMDTLFEPFLTHHGSWSYDNTKIASYCYIIDVGYIDLSTKQMTKITSNSPDNGGQARDVIRDIDWMPDSQNVVWCNGFGI